MLGAERGYPLCTHLFPRGATVRASLQRHLDGHIHRTPTVRIPAIKEKVQLAKFGFDLRDDHRDNFWMPSQVIPQRVAECKEKVFPARPAVDLIDASIRKQLRIALTELSNVDLGQGLRRRTHSAQGLL